MGKGSKRRTQQVSDAQLEENWAKAFSAPKEEEHLQKFWTHDCPFYQNKPLWTLKGSPCNWCDAAEYK